MGARHNGWTAVNKEYFLRCALDKAATQLYWDFGSICKRNWWSVYDKDIALKGNCAAVLPPPTLGRDAEQSSSRYPEIGRNGLLVPSNETTEIVSKDAFLEALRGRELSLKVREREPKSLDEAYRTALHLEAYQRKSESEDRRRPTTRVRGTAEADATSRLQSQLDRFH